MSCQIPVEYAGIQTSKMEAALVEFELMPQGTSKKFPNDFRLNLEQWSSFDHQDNSLILIHRDSLYSTVDLQGDTSQPPRLNFSCEREMSMSAGLALVDSKNSMEILNDKKLNHHPRYNVYLTNVPSLGIT